MQVVELSEGPVVIVAPKGRLDSATSPGLGARLEELAATPASRLILDLAEVDFVSSAGLRVILLAAKRARAAQGTLAICAVQAAVKEVLDISGFTALLSIYVARDGALKALVR